MRSASLRPASVGITLRVVRVRSGAPSRVSSRVIVSLTVEGEAPRRRAAVRNPPASITARRMDRSSSGRCGALFGIPNKLFVRAQIINARRTG